MCRSRKGEDAQNFISQDLFGRNPHLAHLSNSIPAESLRKVGAQGSGQLDHIWKTDVKCRLRPKKAGESRTLVFQPAPPSPQNSLVRSHSGTPALETKDLVIKSVVEEKRPNGFTKVIPWAEAIPWAETPGKSKDKSILVNPSLCSLNRPILLLKFSVLRAGVPQ